MTEFLKTVGPNVLFLWTVQKVMVSFIVRTCVKESDFRNSVIMVMVRVIKLDAKIVRLL